MASVNIVRANASTYIMYVVRGSTFDKNSDDFISNSTMFLIIININVFSNNDEPKFIYTLLHNGISIRTLNVPISKTHTHNNMNVLEK